MNTHALILAAGKGNRFGFPKAWIECNHQSLLQCHIDTLLPLLSVIVVVSSQEDFPESNTYRILENKNEADMMSSIRKGISDLDPQSEILIVPVDTIPQSSHIISMLLEKKAPAVLTYKGKKGHPILLTVQSILSLTEKQTLKDLVDTAQQCESDHSCLYNINYPQDWVSIFGSLPRRWKKNNHPKMR